MGEFRTRSEHVKFNCFLRYIGSRFEQPGDLSSVAYRDEVARAADRARYMVAYHVPVHWHFEAAGGCLAAFHIAVSLTLSLCSPASRTGNKSDQRNMRAFHSEFTEPESESERKQTAECSSAHSERCQQWHCLIPSRRDRYSL